VPALKEYEKVRLNSFLTSALQAMSEQLDAPAVLGINGTLSVSHSRSGRFGEEIKSLPLQRIEPSFLGHPALSPETIPTMPSRLPSLVCVTILFFSYCKWVELLPQPSAYSSCHFLKTQFSLPQWEIGPGSALKNIASAFSLSFKLLEVSARYFKFTYFIVIAINKNSSIFVVVFELKGNRNATTEHSEPLHVIQQLCCTVKII
jgi:hypothetical protein